MKRYLAILFTAVLVAGCGGGGSAQRPTETDPTIAAPPPTTTPETLQALNENALLLLSDAYIHTRDPQGRTLDLTIDSNCNTSGCTLSNTLLEYSQRLTVRDLFDSTDDVTDDILARIDGESRTVRLPSDSVLDYQGLEVEDWLRIQRIVDQGDTLEEGGSTWTAADDEDGNSQTYLGALERR